MKNLNLVKHFCTRKKDKDFLSRESLGGLHAFMGNCARPKSSAICSGHVDTLSRVVI